MESIAYVRMAFCGFFLLSERFFKYFLFQMFFCLRAVQSGTTLKNHFEYCKKKAMAILCFYDIIWIIMEDDEMMMNR